MGNDHGDGRDIVIKLINSILYKNRPADVGELFVLRKENSQGPYYLGQQAT